MSKSSFLSEPAIEITLGGRLYALKPTVTPAGLCIFQTEPIELIWPTKEGAIRISGKFKLVAWSSKGWTVK